MEQVLKKLFKNNGLSTNALLVFICAVICSIIVYSLVCFFSISYQGHVDIYITPKSEKFYNFNQTKQDVVSLHNLSPSQFNKDGSQTMLFNEQALHEKIINELLKERPYNTAKHVKIEPFNYGLRFFVEGESAREAEYLAKTFSDDYKNAILEWQAKNLNALEDEKQELKKNFDKAKLQFEETLFSNLDIVQDDILMKTYVEAVIKRLYYDALLVAIEKCEKEKLSPLSISAVASSPVIRQKIDRLAQIEADIANQSIKLGQTHKTVLGLKAEYSIVETQLAHEITMVIRQFNSDRMIALNVEEQLKQALTTQLNSADKNTSLSLQKQELDNVIQKQIALENDVIQLQNHFEISEITISKKKHFMHAFYAAITVFILILICGVLLAWLHHKVYKNTNINKDEEDLEINSHAFEYLPQAEDDVKFQTPITLTSLSDYIDKHEYKTIALFGATAEEEGAKLALSLFRAGKKTLLIDIAGSEIARHIGIHAGLSDILVGDAILDDTIHQDDDTGVDVLPNGSVSYLRATAFSHRFPTVLKTLKKTYSIIILTIAAEPFLSLPDLLQDETLKVLVPARDSELWKETLLEAGFSDFIYLT